MNLGSRLELRRVLGDALFKSVMIWVDDPQRKLWMSPIPRHTIASRFERISLPSMDGKRFGPY